jgi:hypothetical protein
MPPAGGVTFAEIVLTRKAGKRLTLPRRLVLKLSKRAPRGLTVVGGAGKLPAAIGRRPRWAAVIALIRPRGRGRARAVTAQDQEVSVSLGELEAAQERAVQLHQLIRGTFVEDFFQITYGDIYAAVIRRLISAATLT